jgi:hypothetical protein
MFNTIVGAVGAGDASRYGSGYDQKMRLLAAPVPAPQHCFQQRVYTEEEPRPSVGPPVRYYAVEKLALDQVDPISLLVSNPNNYVDPFAEHCCQIVSDLSGQSSRKI